VGHIKDEERKRREKFAVVKREQKTGARVQEDRKAAGWVLWVTKEGQKKRDNCIRKKQDFAEVGEETRVC